MLGGECPVVVEHYLGKGLPFAVSVLAEVVRGAVGKEFLLILAGNAVLRVEVIFLAESLIVVLAVVVAEHSLELQSLELLDGRSEIIFEGSCESDVLLLVCPVSGNVGSHHCHGVLLEVETVVVEHRVGIVRIGRIEHALFPIVPDDVHGTCIRSVPLVLEG